MGSYRAVFCSIVGLIVAAAADAGPKAFDVSEEQFFARVHRVVIVPCKFPRDFATSDTLSSKQDAVSARVDSLVATGLRQAGFEVMTGTETADLYDAIADSMGGLFDPVTGARDSARSVALEQRARETIRARFQPDAWAFPVIGVATARFEGGFANWHGVNQRVTDESFGKGLLKRVTLRTSDIEYQGTVPALSLFVAIEGDDRTPLYSWAGGIHAISRLKDGKFVPISESSFFSEPERIDRASEQLFKALLKSARKRRPKS